MKQTSGKSQARTILARRNVLRELHAGGPRTARELTAALSRLNVGYSVDAIEDRLRELVDRGLVRLGPAEAVGLHADRRRAGRPPQYATLSEEWGLGVGVEVGRSLVRAAVVGSSGDMVARTRAPRTSPRLESMFRETTEAVDAVLGELSAERLERVVGVVVAVPAPVHIAKHSVAANHLGWGSTALDKRFSDAFNHHGIPVTVVNDANARAVAEGRFGPARAKHSALVIKVSGGIGGALLRRGRVVSGFRGYAGEIGHMSVSLDALAQPPRRLGLPYLDLDARCSCGSADGQHLEAYASADAISRRLRAARRADTPFETIASEWETNDDARHAVEDAAQLIGQAVAKAVMLFDPAIVVVTGRFAACGTAAVQPIRDALAASRPVHEDAPEVVVDGPNAGAAAVQFEWVGVRGAGRLAIEFNTSADDPPVDLS